ncbi:unnamed protein product [Cercospora beticola]|nr:unnamed protein product [Cercospora beticola]
MPKVHRDEYVDQAAAAAIEMRQTVAVDSLVLLSESDEAPVALDGAPNSRRSVTKPVSDRDLAILQKEPKHMTGKELHLLMQHGHPAGFVRAVVNRIGIKLGVADCHFREQTSWRRLNNLRV